KEALLAYLASPRAMIPQSLHPKLQFTSEEVQGLSAYLLTLGAPVAFSAEAPGLFSTNCSTCHIVNGSGGNVGPDLSRVGTYRSAAWLTVFIENPGAVALGAKMPGFQGKLSGAQISDLAAYLFSLKGTTPTTAASPTPTPRSTPVSSPGPAQGQPSYARNVQPIFDKGCTACHGAAAMGGLNLTSYKLAMTTGNHKPVITPGNAETSILFQSLRGKASGVSPMPLGGATLSDEDIATIGRWIERGAPED
ncbi:MAG: c-type cytochrome, partial [Chloroflexota bacterium]